METLASRVEQSGALSAADAVVVVARVVELLRAAGRPHGRVAPVNVCFTGDALDALEIIPPERAERDPSSMSPAALDWDPARESDDVWSSGCLLYFALTGERPWPADDGNSSSRAQPPPPLAVFDAGDDALQEIVDHVFAREVADRVDVLEDVAAALARWTSERGGRASAQQIAPLKAPALDLSSLPPPPQLPGADGEDRETNPIYASLDEETTHPKNTIREGGPLSNRLPSTKELIARARAAPDRSSIPPAGSVPPASFSPSQLAQRLRLPSIPPTETPTPPLPRINPPKLKSSAPPPLPPSADVIEDRPTIPRTSDPRTTDPRTTEDARLGPSPAVPTSAAPPAPAKRSRAALWLLGALALAGAGYATRDRWMGTDDATGPAAARSTGTAASVTSTASAPAQETSALAQETSAAPSLSSVVSASATAFVSGDPVASASVAPIDSASLPPPVIDVAACFAPLFTEDAWAEAPPLDFVCGETDPRKGAVTVREALIKTKWGKPATGSMKEWAIMSYYELATYAAIRGRCCPDARPLELPPIAERCESLQDALNGVAKSAKKGTSETAQRAATKKFRKALICALKMGKGQVLGTYPKPTGGEESAFLKTLQRTRN